MHKQMEYLWRHRLEVLKNKLFKELARSACALFLSNRESKKFSEKCFDIISYLCNPRRVIPVGYREHLKTSATRKSPHANKSLVAFRNLNLMFNAL